MGGNGHHRAGAELHEHEVGHEYGHFLTAQRMDGLVAGGHAQLLLGGHFRLGSAALGALFTERSHLAALLGGLLGQRMASGHGHVGDAHQRIGAGGVHRQRLAGATIGSFDIEAQLDATGFANPVALHGLDLLGPLDVIQIRQQLIGVVGDLQEPQRDLLALYRRTGTPAAAVDNLLIGQHGLVDWVPVHRGHLLVDQSFLHQLGEEPLLPAVVAGIAGGELTAPVVGKP